MPVPDPWWVCDTPLGYSEHLLRRNMGEDQYQEFKTWMRGQTYAIYNGMAVYYRSDVIRFLDTQPNGR